MRLQGMVKWTLASGAAVVSLVGLSSDSQGQCSSCGPMAGSYVPGQSYAGGGFAGGSGNAYGEHIGRGVQPLFDNYFTQGNANQATAGMYMSPIGVPGWVGHTYNTYQPFYPHHYLYQHHDRYHSYYDGGRGLNRTHASYTAPPVRSTLQWAHRKLELPRQ